MGTQVMKNENASRRCPVCDHDQTRLLFHARRAPGPIVRCQHCDLVFVSPVQNGHSIIWDGPVCAPASKALTSADLGDIAGCWELGLLPAKADELSALRLNAADVLDRIEQFVTPPGNLLDFGCGWGFFLGCASERNWQPHGLEPLPGHAVHARARFGATVVTDTLREDTFPSDFFDAITALQVFEHLPNPSGDLAQLHRMLKPGAVILIEVPRIDTWTVRLLGRRHRHFVPDHLNFFSGRTLRLLLETHGFHVSSVYSPTRHMTVRHLIGHWGARYLPQRVSALAEGLIRHLGLWETVVNVNLGDIVVAVARKP